MSTARKIIFATSFLLVGLVAYLHLKPKMSTSVKENTESLTIEFLQSRQYEGSEIVIEETIGSESTYNRHIASYYSDGIKIYALLLVPNSEKPENGFPVIVLNHGYIIPERYTPEGNYIPYFDAFAKAGYVVFKPSYRGHGKSEGFPTSAYFAPDYVIDDLNAIASIKKYPDVDPEKIGVWGHSMGGNITLKSAIVYKDIKAVSIWAGVVAPIEDIIYNWQDRVTYKPDPLDLKLRNQNREILLQKYGTPMENPDFWHSVDPNSYLEAINIPVQIQVGLSDNQVPPSFSGGLYERLKVLDKDVEYFEYQGANHDINQSFSEAMDKTIKFFDKYLKSEI